MGCSASRTDIQLGGIQKWEYVENGKKKALTTEELQNLRKSFWEKDHEGDPEIWKVLKECCEAVLEGNFDKANTLLNSHDIVVISGELNYVTTKDGVRYMIEKYCYSKPSNMVSETSEDNHIMVDETNNKFRFRVGASFLDEEREIIFIFDGTMKPEEDVIPQEHSPENHIFYHTYHFSDNLETITEEEVQQKVFEVIRNFPEVKDKVHITQVRLFYLGRELCHPTPFIKNHIPFESIVVVLVQCE
ncbi:hypothetical protein WA171_005458 [Blastocystis sp. BT1]